MSDLKNINWVKKTRAYYLDRLTRALEARREKKCNIWSDIPKWRLFEWYTALKQGQICWSDLPKSIFAQMNLTTRQDNGIDLVSPDLKTTTQVKHYSKKTPVTQRSIATFVQWSTAILPTAEKQLVTLEETVVSKTVQTILMPRLKIGHTRYSWDQLKKDVEKWNKEKNEEGKEPEISKETDKKKRKRQDAKMNVDEESSSHGKQAKVEEVTKTKSKTKKTVIIKKTKPDESIESKETTINIIETITKKNLTEKTLSPLRPYQEEAMKAFDEKYYQHFTVENRSNSDMMKFRLQMACGTGKSLFAIHIIKKDMDRCPDIIKFPRYLFLCPWIDLANQVAKEFIDNGLDSVSVIGGGSKLDPEKLIWVCVYPSVVGVKQFLDKNKEYRIRVIVIDEAHHLEQVSVRQPKLKPKEKKKIKQSQATNDSEDEMEDEDKTSDSEKEDNEQMSDNEKEDSNIDQKGEGEDKNETETSDGDEKSEDETNEYCDSEDDELDEKETQEREKDKEEKKKWSQVIIEIEAKVCLELSATFHIRSTVDFTYSFDKAVTEGYLTDYIIHVLYMSEGERYAALCDQLIQHLAEYSPMFIYFNNQANAKRCIEIMQSKLEKNKIEKGTCDIILGNDDSEKRQRVLKKMANGKISCLFLCGVFNEGLTFHPLRTIVLGDMRFSKINLYQILMRTNRLHANKSFARVIVPVQDKHFKSENGNSTNYDELKTNKKRYNELTTFCNVLGDWDQRLFDEIKQKDFSRFQVLVHKKDGKETNNVLQAEILEDKIYDRFGSCIAKKHLTPYERVHEFLDIMKKNKDSKEVFNSGSKFQFSNGQKIGAFWRNVKAHGKANIDPFSALLENKVLKKDYSLTIENSHKRRNNNNKLTIEEKVDELLELMKKNNDSRDVFKTTTKMKFSNNEHVGLFWNNVKRKRKCTKKQFSGLLSNKVLEKDYVSAIKKTDARKRKIKLTGEEKVNELLVLMKKNNDSKEVFKQNSRFKFSSGEKIGSFWTTIKIHRKCSASPFSRLLTNRVLEKNYVSTIEKIDTQKKNTKLTVKEKVEEMLALMKKNNDENKVFKQKSQFRFSNGEKIGSFWNNVKSRRQCNTYPLSDLLKNKALEKSYYKQ